MHLSATTSITVHDNPLRNKHLQRIARVIKATWAKGKKERLEETFSSKRQATRIFVHRKNKSCSLFSTHKQRSSRLSCNLVCRPSTFLVYIYIYTQYAYASLDRRNNGIVRARENCNSVVVAHATSVPRNRCATPTRIENRKMSPRSPRV